MPPNSYQRGQQPEEEMRAAPPKAQITKVVDVEDLQFGLKQQAICELPSVSASPAPVNISLALHVPGCSLARSLRLRYLRNLRFPVLNGTHLPRFFLWFFK